MLHPGPALGHVYSSEIKVASLNSRGSVVKSAPQVNWAVQTLLEVLHRSHPTVSVVHPNLSPSVIQ